MAASPSDPDQLDDLAELDAELEDADLDDSELDEADLEEELDADLDEELEEELDSGLEGEAELDQLDEEFDEGDDPDPLALTSFDEEGEEDLVAAVVDEDEDDDVDGLRDGEFVCRSCFMAKRESALADPERMLCRDCA